MTASDLGDEAEIGAPEAAERGREIPGISVGEPKAVVNEGWHSCVPPRVGSSASSVKTNGVLQLVHRTVRPSQSGGMRNIIEHCGHRLDAMRYLQEHAEGTQPVGWATS